MADEADFRHFIDALTMDTDNVFLKQHLDIPALWMIFEELGNDHLEIGFAELGWWQAQGVVTVNGLVIYPGNRDRGLGTAAMTKLCGFADRFGLPMELTVDPLDSEHGLSKAQLFAWYARLGFERVGSTDKMRREPQQA